jgi:hypothetical protein
MLFIIVGTIAAWKFDRLGVDISTVDQTSKDCAKPQPSRSATGKSRFYAKGAGAFGVFAVKVAVRWRKQ